MNFPDNKLKSLQEYFVIPRDMVTKVRHPYSVREVRLEYFIDS